MKRGKLFFISTCHFIHHANIVKRVKTCYKIKIDSRVLVCCFYGVFLHKQHPHLTIAPLLHSNSATIRVQKWHYCMIKVALLECKSGAIALVWFPYSLHTSSLNLIINCASTRYRCTSKLENFAPKILSCAERGVLSVRNANIVFNHHRFNH